MNCFTVLGIEPTTEKKKIKRAYAAKSREFHPEEHPEEFQRIHDAYEEALMGYGIDYKGLGTPVSVGN